MSPEIESHEKLVSTALQPTQRWTPGAKILALALLTVVLCAAYAFIRQFRSGLGETGLGWPVFWGVYIINFVFFIGISHAGTLISAILRVTGAEWRKPLTRMAEAITVFALMTGPLNVIFDLGRPDRAVNILLHPHFTSPLLWDVCCVTTYMIASITYLFLPMIPDIAIMRDRYPNRKLYKVLSLGWTDTEAQQRLLKKVISYMAIIVIPIAVSVHTVVSYVFAMTVKPMWHSSIFGPYFVIGAIYSGIATLLIAMAIIRKYYKLEQYIKDKHFLNLGYLLTTFAVLWMYFTFCEYITTFYGKAPEEMRIFWAKMSGEFAGAFWMMVFTTITAFLVLTLPLIPVKAAAKRRELSKAWVLKPAIAAAGILLFMMMGHAHTQPSLIAYSPPTLASRFPAVGYNSLAVACLVALVLGMRPLLHDRTVLRVVIASVFVNIGMWLERYVIVVPSGSYPRLPVGVPGYHPSMVEYMLTAGCFAWMALLFLVFSRYFPMLPLWEMMEKEPAKESASAVVETAPPVALEGTRV